MNKALALVTASIVVGALLWAGIARSQTGQSTVADPGALQPVAVESDPFGPSRPSNVSGGAMRAGTGALQPAGGVNEPVGQSQPSTVPAGTTRIEAGQSNTEDAFANPFEVRGVVSNGVVNVQRALKIDALGGKVNELVKKLRSADELHKQALIKELETAVSEEFDEDMKRRDAQLTELEERVTKLRAQLDRRRKAKSEITQLKTKVLVNDADGLGFSGSGGSDVFGNRPSTDATESPTLRRPWYNAPLERPAP